MNLKQLRQAVQAEARRLGKRVPPNMVAKYEINKAGDELLRDTTVARETRTFNAVANSPKYTVTGNVLKAYRARHNGVPLSRVSPEDLEAGYGANWETVTGTPTGWYMDAVDVFRPWKIPNQNLTDGFKLDIAVGWQVDLAQDSDDPALLNKLPEKYHRALAHAAAYSLFGAKDSLLSLAKITARIQSDISERYSEADGYVPFRYL